MKNILIIATLSLVSMFVVGQTKVTEVTPNGYITKPSYVYVFGVDTITNATADTTVLRIKGNKMQDFNIQLYHDWVSGTAGGTLVLQQSIDGVTYNAEVGDTITFSSVTGDGLDSEVIYKNDFLKPYLKLIYTQTGTTVTVPKAYIYTKQN